MFFHGYRKAWLILIAMYCCALACLFPLMTVQCGENETESVPPASAFHFDARGLLI